MFPFKNFFIVVFVPVISFQDTQKKKNNNPVQLKKAQWNVRKRHLEP